MVRKNIQHQKKKSVSNESLGGQPKKLEEEEQIKLKARRGEDIIKIRAEIRKIKNIKEIKKISNTKTGPLKRSTKN